MAEKKPSENLTKALQEKGIRDPAAYAIQIGKREAEEDIAKGKTTGHPRPEEVINPRAGGTLTEKLEARGAKDPAKLALSIGYQKAMKEAKRGKG